MSTESLWETYAETTNYPSLIGEETADVVVIGGGVSGITTAQLLSEQGLKVIVLESFHIGVSNTAHSTGNLYETLGKELAEINKKHGKKVAQKVVDSRREAVNLIEDNIRRFNIDCDFKRVPWFYYSAIPEMDSKIEDEYNLEKDLNLAGELTEIDEVHLKARKCLRLENQAQFNPLRYVQGLAAAIVNDHCFIYERTIVESVKDEGESCVVHTNRGTVTAKHVVHATHTPKGVMSYHTLLGPYREYGIACKIKNPQHAPGIYFGFYETSTTTSTRLYERNGEHYLVVVGEPHKVGQGDSNYHMRRLESFASKFFEVEKVTHAWGGQHYKPADELPYIGRKDKTSKTFVATGFSTHGLTYGTLAAQIITDQIMDRENKYEEIYSPSRFNPIKSAPKFFKENANVFFELVKDYMKNDKVAFAEVASGEGRVIDHDGHKMAVYRDEDHKLQVCSAICPHMGCVVHWNNAETSWDCPCHGSRFDTKGEVLEGPALKALAKVELVDDKMPLRNPIPTIQDALNTGLS